MTEHEALIFIGGILIGFMFNVLWKDHIALMRELKLKEKR